MIDRWLCALAAVSAAAALSAAALAQQPSTLIRVAQIKQPQLRDDEQILPSQIVQPPAAKRPPATRPAAVTPSVPEDDAPPKAGKPPEPACAVACSGNFAKDSGHLKLAQAYGSQNITFADVDGDDGSTLKASVLFPKDPKHRLEV